jgi:hypothetical protein
MLAMKEILCATLKQSLASILPWDIPWYDSSHTVFFAALYSALGFIGLGVLIAVMMTIKKVRQHGGGSHH